MRGFVFVSGARGAVVSWGKLRTIALSASLLICACGQAIARIEVTDDSGQVLVFSQPVARIVSLTPHITELLFAAGAGERIVATVRYSDFPEEAARIPRIGDSNLLDFERVVAHKPDLIIAWLDGSAESQMAKLRTLGIPIYYNKVSTLDDIASSLVRFGRLAGTEAVAQEAAQRFVGEVAALRERYENRRPLSLFFQVWHRPLLTINGEHLASDIMRLCGGRNIFAARKLLVPFISIEAVLGADPDAIVATSGEPGGDDGLDAWRRFKSLRAAAENNFIVLDADTMSRHTPRVVRSATVLCKEMDKLRARP
ncbi:MAG: cobalamin-binding protein [Burkholderiales bacterium]|nr:cobalamin-binding protein [Burkholderiales bacterium]